MDGKDKKIKNCFSCGKTVDHDFDSDNPATISALHEALVFRATGNFGSAIYDPMGPTEEFLEIHICDQCVRDRHQHVKHVAVERKQEGTMRNVEFDEDGDIVFK